MSIEFLRPAFLAFAILGVVVWFFPRRQSGVATRLLRSIVLMLIAVALAQPVVVVRNERIYQIAVVDRSESVAAEAHGRLSERLREWRTQLSDLSRAKVVVFGKDTGAIALPDLDGVARVPLHDDSSASPLSAALSAALRQIPEGETGAITLFTDGLATDRRWGPAVREMIQRGIPVKAIDLGQSNRAPRPVGLSTQPRLHVGHTTQVVVDVAGDAPRLVVRLSDGTGRELARSPVFACEGRARVPLEFEPAEAGFVDLRAEVLDGDSLTAAAPHHEFLTTVAVQAPVRVLYLGGRVTDAAVPLGELLGRGFTITDGNQLALDAATDLRAFDLVMVDDRPVGELPEDFQARLATAVRADGLGLLYTGGRASFGTGGYANTPVADLLPVDIVQRAEKQDPSTALALIIDTSGSMRGQRIELAKQIASLAVRRLKAHDRVGIVEFYGNKHWALPLQSAANKIAIERAIGRMQAQGGTLIIPAIEEAYYGLKNVTTRFKHIIIVTDAGVEDADYEGLLSRIARDKITVSTVLVGGQAHSDSLLDMATWGNGRFYTAADRFALPEILLKQATTTNLPAYKEGLFVLAARGGHTWWDDIDSGAVPSLAGYVETQARPGAEVLLEVDEAGHPVLATWQFGAGRVTALMTEPLGEGAAPWRNWSAYGRWLARLAGRTAGEQLPYRFEITRRDDEVLVTAHAMIEDKALIPQAMTADDAETTPVVFDQMAPNRFEARLQVAPESSVRLTAHAADADGARVGPRTLLVSPAFEDIAREHQVDPERSLDLKELARITGGAHQLLEAPLGELPRPASPNGSEVIDLWGWAALLALLIYLAEILNRRWPSSLPFTPAFASRP